MAYGEDGVLLEPYWLTYVYEIKTDEGGEDDGSGSIIVPDTGGVLGNLKIAKSDYLITGLMIFFLAGVSGIYFVAKDRKKSKRKK